LRVRVSGGFSAADDALASSDDGDIAVVGRSIADAVAPADMAQQLTSIVRKFHTEERL
jgi:3-keto-L-gulonate-6-phosphate decarboxylase